MTTPKPPDIEHPTSPPNEPESDDQTPLQPDTPTPITPIAPQDESGDSENENEAPDKKEDPYKTREQWIDIAHVATFLILALGIIELLNPLPWRKLLAIILAAASATTLLSLYFRKSSRHQAAILQQRTDLEELERFNFADLPITAQELIRQLRIRHDESARMYSRSLRASPILFACGVLSALTSIVCLGAGVWYVLTHRDASIDKWVRATTLIETGTSAILLGAIATGFFSWRRDLHRHALTFFDDMIHTRSVQTAIRLLASMPGWFDTGPAQATYLSLIRSVSRRGQIRQPEKTDEFPQSLTPSVIEKSIDALKDISIKVANTIGRKKL
jgi:hypothetical protein